MKTEQVIRQLEANRLVFKALLESKEKSVVLWKPEGHAWTILEIVCYFLDEERGIWQRALSRGAEGRGWVL